MKIKKARLQQLIQEEFRFHEKKKLREATRWDNPAGGHEEVATPEERMKDDLQTVMMDSAMEFMRSQTTRAQKFSQDAMAIQ